MQKHNNYGILFLKQLLERYEFVLHILTCIAIISILNTNNILSNVFKHSLISCIKAVAIATEAPFTYATNIKNSTTKVIQALQQNEELKRENYILKSKINELRESIEWQNAHNQLSMLVDNHDGKNQIYTRVISITNSNSGSMLLLSAGSNDGVSSNSVVLNEEGLVGLVIQVDAHSSMVMTVLDENSRVPVISKETKVNAILLGGKKLLLQNSSNQILDNEDLVTSGAGGTYPPNIPVAKYSGKDSASLNINQLNLKYVIVTTEVSKAINRN